MDDQFKIFIPKLVRSNVVKELTIGNQMQSTIEAGSIRSVPQLRQTLAPVTSAPVTS